MIGQFKFIGKPELQFGYGKPNKLVLTLDSTSTTACKQIIDELSEDKTYKCEVGNNSKKRTLGQNAYFWVLCDRIADRLHESKEAVYRGYIKDYGESTTLCMLTKAVDRYKEIWSKKGLGWFCESMPSKIPNCTNVMAYYGSSVYDTRQMNRLIDAVIADCEELNISYEVDGYELTQGKR